MSMKMISIEVDDWQWYMLSELLKQREKGDDKELDEDALSKSIFISRLEKEYIDTFGALLPREEADLVMKGKGDYKGWQRVAFCGSDKKEIVFEKDGTQVQGICNNEFDKYWIETCWRDAKSKIDLKEQKNKYIRFFGGDLGTRNLTLGKSYKVVEETKDTTGKWDDLVIYTVVNDSGDKVLLDNKIFKDTFKVI